MSQASRDITAAPKKLSLLSGILAVEADVDLVFDPPWGRHMMSEAAQLETGML